MNVVFSIDPDRNIHSYRFIFIFVLMADMQTSEKYVYRYIYIYIYIYYYYYYYCDPSSLTSDSTPDRFRLFPGPRTWSSGLVCRTNGPGPPKRGQEGLSL